MPVNRRSAIRRFLAALVAAVLSSAASIPAGAATETLAGGVTFDMADGWTRKEGKGGAILLQKAVPPEKEGGKGGAALIQILGPVTSDSFDANWASLAKSVPELAAKKPSSRKTGTTINGHTMRLERRCCGYRNDVMMSSISIGIEADGKQYFAMFLAMNLRGGRSRDVENEFETMVRTMRFTAADRPFGLYPPRGGGGLEGVYTHLQTGLRPNAFGGMDFQADSRIHAFDKSGIFATELPKGGISIPDHCKAKPRDCGTYRLVGGGFLSSASAIEMSEVVNGYGMIETETKPFAKSSDSLKIDGTVWRHVPPPPRGTPFDGVWRHFWAQSGSMAFSSGGVSSERTLRMTSGGEYWRDGYTGFMSSNEVGDTRTSVAGGGRRPEEHGRYRVDGYAIRLTGDDGKEEVMSLFQPGGDDGLLVINGNNYLKRDGKK